LQALFPLSVSGLSHRLRGNIYNSFLRAPPDFTVVLSVHYHRAAHYRLVCRVCFWWPWLRHGVN
jgi:hypothetical protein